MQPPPHRPRHNETGRPQPFHQGLSADTGEKQVGISRRSPAVAIYWRSIATTSSSESSPRFVSLSSKTRFGNSSRSNVDCDDCARILFSCERFLGHVLRRRCHVQDIKSIAAEGAARRLAHRQRHHSVQAAIGCIAVQGPSAINGCPQIHPRRRSSRLASRCLRRNPQRYAGSPVLRSQRQNRTRRFVGERYPQSTLSDRQDPTASPLPPKRTSQAASPIRAPFTLYPLPLARAVAVLDPG